MTEPVPLHDYCASSNSLGCWQLAIAAQREQLVRAGKTKPSDEREERQAQEGIRPVNQLDVVRGI